MSVLDQKFFCLKGPKSLDRIEKEKKNPNRFGNFFCGQVCTSRFALIFLAPKFLFYFTCLGPLGHYSKSNWIKEFWAFNPQKISDTIVKLDRFSWKFFWIVYLSFWTLIVCSWFLFRFNFYGAIYHWGLNWVIKFSV